MCFMASISAFNSWAVAQEITATFIRGFETRKERSIWGFLSDRLGML